MKVQKLNPQHTGSVFALVTQYHHIARKALLEFCIPNSNKLMYALPHVWSGEGMSRSIVSKYSRGE